MSPSALYQRLLDLSQKHAIPTSLEEILSIRAPDAIHAWGHRYLVSRQPKLADRMDNAAFKAHLLSTGPYLGVCESKLHSITIDEHQRTSVVHMSYFLRAEGSEEVVEQDLIWTLRFSNEEMSAEKVLITESVEFIDAAASGRVAEIVRGIHGEVSEHVRGGLTVQL